MIDAEYCINLDGGEFERQGDHRLLTAIQASEKVYADFQLESLNRRRPQLAFPPATTPSITWPPR